MIVWNPKDGPPRLRIPEPPADHAAAEREAEFILRQDDAPMTWVQLARAYRELRVERDSLRERLAANSGWAEDADLAALREELEVNAKILANRERECIALREDKAQAVLALRDIVHVNDNRPPTLVVIDCVEAAMRGLRAARASQQEGRDD